jgi:hypothetical protein
MQIQHHLVQKLIEFPSHQILFLRVRYKAKPLSKTDHEFQMRLPNLILKHRLVLALRQNHQDLLYNLHASFIPNEPFFSPDLLKQFIAKIDQVFLPAFIAIFETSFPVIHHLVEPVDMQIFPIDNKFFLQ